jgi:ribonucleoside-diphosphate reductase alpha chain
MRETGVLAAPQRAEAMSPPRLMAGQLCPEYWNPSLIHKDGCDFCTACGYVGQRG